MAGRPLGSVKYLKILEEKTGRMLIKQKPGPEGPYRNKK